MLKLLEENLRHSYALAMCRRWLSLRSELTGNMSVLLASMLAVAQRGAVSAGWSGLAVSLAMGVTETFNCVLNNGAAVEEKAVALERLREMAERTPREKRPRRMEGDPTGRWLTRGEIAMEELSLSHVAGGDRALERVSLRVEAGQRVGVCGRTGAGKTTLVEAMFDLADEWSGKVALDGVDVTSLGMDTLRYCKIIIAIPLGI